MFNMKLFADDLFMFRSKKKLSRAKAAHQIDVHPSTIQSLEEYSSDPRIITYYKVCKWMGKSMEFYFINN